jgi:hypothetical protein
VGGEDAGEPFYRVRGGAGRPSVEEERAPAVVHHNGVVGGCFRSGIDWGVMGGTCSSCYGSRRGRGTGRRQRTREPAAVPPPCPSGWWRKTKGGARVSEGERRTRPSWPKGQGPIGVVEG